MAKTLIFGAGAVGSIYGYILTRASSNVTFVCRGNYTALQTSGLTIRSKIFGNQTCHPNVSSTVAEAAQKHGPFDYILVCSKAFPGTAELIRDAVTNDTAIVLTQNGIGIEEDYARLYPNNLLISGVVWLPTTQVEPGVIEHGPLERFEIGTFPADAGAAGKAKAKHLAEMWQKAGATCVLHEDVQPRRWVKLAVNASWNPCTALSLCDDANLLRSSGERSESVIREVMTEVGKIAAAAGYPDAVTGELIEKDLERPRSRLETGGKEPSMLTDVRNGRRMEVEAILGNTVRLAEKFGVDVPRLGLLYVLAKALDFSTAKTDGWKPIARH